MPDRSVDVVVAAQCFHWFDLDRALPEIARVLKPGGRLALVWNLRDERIPWVRRLGRIIGSQDQSATTIAEPLVLSGLFGFVEDATFRTGRRSTASRSRTWSLSRSNVATLDEDARAAKLAEVLAFYDDYGRGMDGMQLPYDARCFKAVVNDRPRPGGRRRGRRPGRRLHGRAAQRRHRHRHAADRLPVARLPLITPTEISSAPHEGVPARPPRHRVGPRDVPHPAHREPRLPRPARRAHRAPAPSAASATCAPCSVHRPPPSPTPGAARVGRDRQPPRPPGAGGRPARRRARQHPGHRPRATCRATSPGCPVRHADRQPAGGRGAGRGHPAGVRAVRPPPAWSAPPTRSRSGSPASSSWPSSTPRAPG